MLPVNKRKSIFHLMSGFRAVCSRIKCFAKIAETIIVGANFVQLTHVLCNGFVELLVIKIFDGFWFKHLLELLFKSFKIYVRHGQDGPKLHYSECEI